jgi:8-oxo-dGTP pyrophosphatase MutT (NUDIX family)
MPAIYNSSKALLIRDTSILLQECLIDGRIRYLLPGGGQRFGESLSETVRREVLEETGLKVRTEEIIWVREYIVNNDPSSKDHEHRVEFIFRCTPESDTGLGMSTHADAAQVGIRWVPIEALPGIVMWPETVQRLLIAQNGDVGASGVMYLGNCP